MNRTPLTDAIAEVFPDHPFTVAGLVELLEDGGYEYSYHTIKNNLNAIYKRYEEHYHPSDVQIGRYAKAKVYRPENPVLIKRGLRRLKRSSELNRRQMTAVDLDEEKRLAYRALCIPAGEQLAQEIYFERYT